MKKLAFAPVLVASAGLISLASAMGIGRFLYTPILPAMAEALNLTQGEAGLIASANFIGYLLGALGAASRTLPGQARNWLLGALFVSALTTATMGLTDSLTAFLILRLLGGMASAFALVFTSVLVLERLGGQGQNSLSTMHFAGVGAGIALSAVMTWSVNALEGDWRAMWYAGGLFSLLAVLAVALFLPRDRHDEAALSPASKGAGKPRLWPLVTAYGLFGFGYVITATFIVAIVRESPESIRFEPFVWLLVGLSALPSVSLWAIMGRRFGMLRAFGLACVLEALGVGASVLWVSIPGLLMAAVFLGATFMGITALGLMAASTLSGGEPRRALALMTAAFGLGQIIGPVVAGFGHDLTGSFFLPSMMAAGALVAAAALSRYMEISRRSVNPS